MNVMGTAPWPDGRQTADAERTTHPVGGGILTAPATAPQRRRESGGPAGARLVSAGLTQSMARMDASAYLCDPIME